MRARCVYCGGTSCTCLDTDEEYEREIETARKREEQRRQHIAARVVREIETEILDRPRLKHGLRQCDPAARREIRRAWRKIVVDVLAAEDHADAYRRAAGQGEETT